MVAAVYFFPQVMAWLSVAINCLLYIILGVGIYSETQSTVGLLFCVYGGVLIILAYVARKKITMAGRHLQTAAVALTKNPSLIPAVSVLELLLLGAVAVFWFGSLKFSQNLEPKIDCLPGISETAQRMYYFLLFMFFWTCAWLKSAKLITTAMTVGSWAFAQEDRPRLSGLVALRITLTKSAATISVGSLITGLVDFIVDAATERFWFLSPAGCILKFIFVIAQGCIMALTRYAFVGHAFTGLTFFESSKIAYKVLEKNLIGGYVVQKVGASVVYLWAKVFAICLGLAAWQWIDQDNDWDTLSSIVSLFDDSLFLVILFIVIWLYFIQMPMLTLMLLTFVVNVMKTILSTGTGTTPLIIDAQIWAPFCGVFVSCVAAIILNFIGELLLDAITAIFMAHAVGTVGGKSLISGDDRELVALLMDDIPEGKPVMNNDNRPMVLAVAHPA